MWIVLLLVLGIPALVTGLTYLFDERKIEEDRVKNALGVGLILFVILGMLVGFTLLGENLRTASQSRQLEAIYYNNIDVYREAVNETEDALYIEIAQISEMQLISGENWEQSSRLSERIMELRDEVASYNKNLRLRRYWDSNPWTNWFIQAPDPEIKYLQLR